MNILIVEDEPTSLKLAHVVMETEGYSVQNSDTAEKALESIKKQKPQVILLDLALPGMSGLELARILKANPETRNIPIVAITFYPNRFKREEALAAGCDAYVVKPVNTRDLPNLVGEIINK